MAHSVLGDPEPEVALEGGRVTAGVVRVGETVRRPTSEHSTFVHQLLRLLERRDVASVPRLIGVDDQGREILTFHEGWVPPNLEWRKWSAEQITSAARIVRQLHDATAGSALAGAADVVCHGDLSPCNFVFVNDTPTYLIDFDRAHPGSRKSDLAYMAWCWLVGREDDARAPSLEARLRQLSLLLDSYGLEDRGAFAHAIEVEQLQIRDEAAERGNNGALDWVRGEIEFVQARADLIDAAAMAA